MHQKMLGTTVLNNVHSANGQHFLSSLLAFSFGNSRKLFIR